MSRLLGPLSVTTSKVSWRPWALAGDHTAGAGNRLPAATAVIDLRNSRRFMAASARVRQDLALESARPMPAGPSGAGQPVRAYAFKGKLAAGYQPRATPNAPALSLLSPNPCLNKN